MRNQNSTLESVERKKIVTFSNLDGLLIVFGWPLSFLKVEEGKKKKGFVTMWPT